MNITPMSSISFKADLKRLFDKGKLPSVTHGFYGMPLTKENVSREHLLPRSLGGKTKESNIVLADKFINWQRSSQPLTKFAHEKEAVEYLEQFKDISLPDFNGKTYIKNVASTLNRLGLDIREQARQIIEDAPSTIKEVGKHLDLKA